jgi:hypothetical protein
MAAEQDECSKGGWIHNIVIQTLQRRFNRVPMQDP